MIKSTLINTLYGIWPMIVIVTVILASFRITYLICRKEKFVLYKELYTLAFIIYILMLFYIVTFQDNNYNTSNFIPFKEILRYDFGSSLFFKNIVGNILLFLPFGLFISSFIKSKSCIPIVILAFISSLSIELTQMAIGRVFDVDDVILNIIGGIFGYTLYFILSSILKKLPGFFRKDWFINIIIIIILTCILFYFTNIHTYIIGLVT